MRSKTCGTVLIALFYLPIAHAEPFFIDSEFANSYHFVDTYEILIERPPDVVWPQLANLASWMGAMLHESGPVGAEGEVFRLYEGQNFFAQIVKIVPEKMLVVVNLPSSVEGEELEGISMLTLTEVDGSTLVSNFMSRHFHWIGAGPDVRRERRTSPEYQEFNREMWEEQLLPRLRELAEGAVRPE